MTEPAAGEGQSADGADLASTDMDANPSGTSAPEARYAPDPSEHGAAEGDVAHAGVPVEPAPEAIRRLEGELADLRDRHLRLAAEFENYRRRVARERIELADRAQAAFVLRLLDILDDMDRLVATGPQNMALDALSQALLLIDRKLRKELEGAGVERIDPVGSPFDPTEQEAVATVPAPDPANDQVVSATFQPGYRFKGQLVRPARVQVYSMQGAG